MTIIESLRQYFMMCPVFSEKRINIDYLGADAESFALSEVPTERILQKYVDGSTVRRQLFTLSSRTFFGPDLQQQQENIEFFEDLEAWLDAQDVLGQLPALGEKRRARSLNILSSAYPVEVDDGDHGTVARYQIQMELIYLQEV